MHLDTVFTMVDYDKFTIHPAIQGQKEYEYLYFRKGPDVETLKITHRTSLWKH